MFDGQTITPRPFFIVGTRSLYSVNGVLAPSFPVSSGSAALLRLVHAAGTRALVLKLSRPELCTVRLLARDGVFQQAPFLTMSKVPMAQGGRADLAVLCNAPEGVVADVRVEVRADADDIGPLWGNVHEQAVVFTIVIKPAMPAALRLALPADEAVTLPGYLASLLDEPVVREAEVVDLDDMAINTVKFKGFDAPLAERYLMQPQCLNQVYQFSLAPFEPSRRRRRAHVDPSELSGDEGLHVYHQHINHFQIESLYGANVEPEYVRVGEFRDSMWQLLTNVLIRTKPVDFTGEVVIHCHVSQHGDHGMMALFPVSVCDP